MKQKQLKVKFPPKFQPLFTPAWLKIYHGGRAGMKSWQFARAQLLLGIEKKRRFLCTREFQVSIRDSVHKVLADQIEKLGLPQYFKVLEHSIRAYNGSEWIFRGLHDLTADSIKSLEGIDYCWVEEGQSLSQRSWDILWPTIVRNQRAEIWISANRDLETDVVTRMIDEPPPGAYVREVLYTENPYLPKKLIEEAARMARNDPEAYAHIWLGQCRRNSSTQIFKRYRIEEFIPNQDWDGPYFGCDWGFSVDPTVLVKCWINDNQLYIEHEAYGIGVELDDIARLFREIPQSTQYVIRADSARPETIAHLIKHYRHLTACKKWAGCVEDGIAHMKNYDMIVLHPRCANVTTEFRMYSYKTNRGGDILTDIEDRWNHTIDAIRYALEPLIKGDTGYAHF